MSSLYTFSSKITGERAWVVAILSCLLILLCKLYLPKSAGGKLRERQFWIQKTFAPSTYDGVIIGDSRAYRGIDPATLAEELRGARILNFGFSSAGISTELIAAGVEKLASGGDRIVLLSVSPFSLTSEGCSNEHFKGERRRTREEIVEALYFGELMSFFEPLDPLELLSGKYQEALGAQLSETYYHEDYQPTGWVASWKKKWDTSHALQSYQDTFERTDLDADCVAGVLTTVRELAQRGYRVYGVRPPIHTQLLALEESFLRGRFEEIRRKLVDVGVVWLELPLTTTETYDGSHLTKEAAVEFSRQLGRSIR